jgi:hypothetical protein
MTVGQVAFYGKLNGPPDEVLLKDGDVLVALLDILPDIAPYHLISFTIGGGFPIRIGNTGQVLWKGVWDEPWSGDPEPSPRGLFLDTRLLVRNGATTADGQLIESIQYQHLSRSGRYAAFNAVLQGDKSGLFVIDLLSSIIEVTGCLGRNRASLAVESGMPVVGSDLTLVLDGAQASGALGFLALSTSEPADTCGVLVPGVGEVLLSGPLQIWSAGAWSGDPLSVALAVPDSLTFIGTVVRVQGGFVDATPGATEPVRLSDGLALRVGTF